MSKPDFVKFERNDKESVVIQTASNPPLSDDRLLRIIRKARGGGLRLVCDSPTDIYEWVDLDRARVEWLRDTLTRWLETGELG